MKSLARRPELEVWNRHGIVESDSEVAAL